MNRDMPRSYDGRRRMFVSVATSTYASSEFSELGCAGEVRVFTEWLCDAALRERAFTHAFPELADNPSISDLDGVFGPERKVHWKWDDVLFVYVTGHAFYQEGTAGGQHFIALTGADPTEPSKGMIPTHTLIQWIQNLKIEDVALILDVCYPRKGALQLGTLQQLPETWLVLGTSVDDVARVGVAARAVKTYLEENSNPTSPFFDRGQFVAGINEKLAAGGQKVYLPQGELPRPGQSPCLPNAGYLACNVSLAISAKGERRVWVRGPEGPELHLHEAIPVAEQRANLVVSADGTAAVALGDDVLVVSRLHPNRLSTISWGEPVPLGGLGSGRVLAVEPAGVSNLAVLWSGEDGTWLLSVRPGCAIRKVRQLSRARSSRGALGPDRALLVPASDSGAGGPCPALPSLISTTSLTVARTQMTELVHARGTNRGGEVVDCVSVNGGPERVVTLPNGCIIEIRRDESRLSVISPSSNPDDWNDWLYGPDPTGSHVGWISYAYAYASASANRDLGSSIQSTLR